MLFIKLQTVVCINYRVEDVAISSPIRSQNREGASEILLVLSNAAWKLSEERARVQRGYFLLGLPNIFSCIMLGDSKRLSSAFSL